MTAHLHSDTTTVSFYGDYDTDAAKENAENPEAETGATGTETVENNGGTLKILKEPQAGTQTGRRRKNRFRMRHT